MEIKEGQILYRDRKDRHNPAEITKYEVERIGKKYIYLKNNDRYPIDKKTLKYTNNTYSQDSFQLYLTEQEILDRREESLLWQELKGYFNHWNNAKYTLEQLRKVKEILNTQKDN